jgi:hypothetical protein
VNIRARPTPPEDRVLRDLERDDERRLLRDVRAAKASDMAKGTGPRRNSPKSYHEVPGPDLAPDVTPTPKPDVETKPDLHSALTDVANKLLEDEPGRPATLGNLGWALHSVARQIAPKPVTAPEIGERDTSGLFGTPSPERNTP